MPGELCVQHLKRKQQFSDTFLLSLHSKCVQKTIKVSAFSPVQYPPPPTSQNSFFYPHNTDSEASAGCNCVCGLISPVADDICRIFVKVLPNSVIMNCSSCGNKQMPNGMSEWNDPITLEENHAHAINQTSPRNLLETIGVVL